VWGPRGAVARIRFRRRAPTPDKVEKLDKALEHFAKPCLARVIGHGMCAMNTALGAAGGLGSPGLAVCMRGFRPGIELGSRVIWSGAGNAGR